MLSALDKTPQFYHESKLPIRIPKFTKKNQVKWETEKKELKCPTSFLKLRKKKERNNKFERKKKIN